MQFLIVNFFLRVKNKPYDGVANCAFILSLGMVMNSLFLTLGTNQKQAEKTQQERNMN
jgi:hypothetical protein